MIVVLVFLVFNYFKVIHNKLRKLDTYTLQVPKATSSRENSSRTNKKTLRILMEKCVCV